MRRKLLWLLFLVPALVLAAGPSSGEESWLEDPITGCRIWNPEPKGNETISWSGGCKDGKASGFGVLSLFEDGKLTLRFEGKMVEGKAQDVGRSDFLVEDGFAHYQGEFKDSRLHGVGVLTLPDKSRAEGDFRDDSLNGYVEYQDADGSRYIGEVKNNEPDGKGRQILAGGEEYIGTFVDGVRSGTGTLLLPNGDIYTGEYKAGRPEGEGKLQTVEGGTYEGPFHNGEPHGEGVFTTPEGEVGRGKVVNGVPEGKIIFTAADGGTRVETWENGKKVSP